MPLDPEEPQSLRNEVGDALASLHRRASRQSHFMTESPWRAACFDLDGTLVRGTTVSQHLADAFGHGEILADLERRYSAQEISNAEVANFQATHFRGRRPEELMEALKSIPRIGAIEETLERLRVRASSGGMDSRPSQGLKRKSIATA